jgi:hypothetical protein
MEKEKRYVVERSMHQAEQQKNYRFLLAIMPKLKGKKIFFDSSETGPRTGTIKSTDVQDGCPIFFVTFGANRGGRLDIEKDGVEIFINIDSRVLTIIQDLKSGAEMVIMIY